MIDSDRCDGTGILCLDIVLHFHRFKYDNGITDGYGVAYLDIDTGDSTGEWRLLGVTGTCGSRLCRSSRSGGSNRSGTGFGCLNLGLYDGGVLGSIDRLLQFYLKWNAEPGKIALLLISLNFKL